MRNREDESELTASLNYLNPEDVEWYNKHIESWPIATILRTLFLNFDHWLGKVVRGKK